MKKLLIAAIVAGAAICSQAAKINWAISCVDDETLATQGYAVYVCNTAVAGATLTGVGDLASYMLGSSGNTGVLDEGFWGTGTDGTVIGLSDDLDGQMQDLTYVIVNGDASGYWMQNSSGEVYTTNTEPVWSEEDVWELVSTTEATKWSTGPTPTPTPTIPEPTSGLLLLVGVAGLALRRKQK